MPDSVRQTIVAAVATKLEAIRQSGGYNTDVGAAVKTGLKVGQLGDCPFAVLVPGDDDATIKYGTTVCEMDIQVLAFNAISGRDPYELNEQTLADLIKCLSGQTVGEGRAHYTGGGAYRWPEPGDQALLTQAHFRINYQTAVGDPYTAK
jgi:hypothetical protein